MTSEPRQIATSPTRPLLRYFGGKWKLAPSIISHFRKHNTYVEPFCGGASVLLRKARLANEIISDLDADLINLLLVARDRGQELIEQVIFTPYSFDEFRRSFEQSESPIEQARRTLVRSAMGVHSNSTKTGWRSDTKRNSAIDWGNFPAALQSVCSRLNGVTILQESAFSVIPRYDSPGTLFYVDPPYTEDQLSTHGRAYRHQFSQQQHLDLASVLHSVQGAVAISGYRSALYDDLYADWSRIDFATKSAGRSARMECLWLSQPGVQLLL